MQVASSLPSQNLSSSSSTGSTSYPQPNGAAPPIHLPLAQAGAGPTAGPHHLKVSPPSSLRTSSSPSSSSATTSSSTSSTSSAQHLSASTPSQIASFLGAHLAASAPASLPATAGTATTQPQQQHGPGAPKACSQCETTNTPCWRRGPSGAILCNACGLKFSRRRNQTTPGDAPLGGSVKPKVAAVSKPLPTAAGSVVVDGDKGFGGGRSLDGTLPRRTKSEDSQVATSRVNTAAALLEEIKKEREERLSSSGGSHPHALRGGSADVSTYTQGPMIGFSQLQQRPTGSDHLTVRGSQPNLPWPLDNHHQAAKQRNPAGQSVADGDASPGGLPTLELFSGLQFMKPRGSGGGSGSSASHNQRINSTKSRGKRRAGRDNNRGSRSDEEEDSDFSSSDDDDDDNQALVLRQHNGTKRRQDNLELGLEQYAGESKRMRTSTRERKANLWTLDAHLHYLSIWLEYLNTYKNHIWTISPLDPAALDHNNARHLLCTNEGAEDRSALSLSVNFCLAIGALMHGDEKSHMEFYMRARQHLGYLFDTTDYSVALALIAMSHHTMYWEADAKRSEYYLTLAINIIAQLGAFHSDVYHRCLCMHSLTFRHGSSDLAKMVKLKQELRRAKQMPYYPITQSANSVVPYDMFRHLRFVTGATGIMTSVVAGINLFKAVSSSQGAVSPEQQIVFRKLIQALDDLDNEIRSLQGMDAPSPATALTMLAFITALRAECYMCLGDYKTGLSWANRFLQDSRKPHFRFVIAGVVLMLDMVMGILLRANQFAMLAAQMDAIDSNCVSCPTLDLVKNKYKKHLIEDIQRRHIEDSRAADAGMLATAQPQRPALMAPILTKQEVLTPPRERESSPASFLASSSSPVAAMPSSRSNQWQYAQLSSTPGFSPSSTIKSECDSTVHTPNAESNPTVEQVLAFASAQMGHQGGEGQNGEGADWLDRDRYEAPSPPPLDDHEYFNGLLNDQDEGLLQQFLNS